MLPCRFMTIHFNIIFPSTARYSKWSLLGSHHGLVCTSPLHHTCYLLRPSPSLDHRIIVGGEYRNKTPLYVVFSTPLVLSILFSNNFLHVRDVVWLDFFCTETINILIKQYQKISCLAIRYGEPIYVRLLPCCPSWCGGCNGEASVFSISWGHTYLQRSARALAVDTHLTR